MVLNSCRRFDSNRDHLQVKRFQAHKGPVNDLCFDEAAEFVGSCSDDGGAMVRHRGQHAGPVPYSEKVFPHSQASGLQVHSLYTDEVSKFKYSRPIKVHDLYLLFDIGSTGLMEMTLGGLYVCLRDMQRLAHAEHGTGPQIRQPEDA